jgi:O-succinylbenzoic acid--CoA ligase
MNVFHEEMIKEFLSQNTQFQAASLVPTMLKRLLDDPLFRTHHKFKAILMGGGPSNENLLRRAAERGIPLVSSYGMTETCAQIVANPMHIPSGTYTPIKSVGKPFPPNQLEIRDQSGKKLGMNESGTIWLKGPQVFDGYYQSDAQPFDEDGWFNTGDFGHLNGFGLLFIESRRTDIIITGGENVNPAIVESAMEQVPEIEEAVVIGLPNEEWGQKIVAVAKLYPGKKLELSALKKALKNKLRDFQIPKDLRIVDEFPQTNTGKIKRKALKQLF